MKTLKTILLSSVIAVLAFAPAKSGYQISEFNTTFSNFFAVASAVGALVSGRMMGRMRDMLWWVPFWMSASMLLYLGAVKMIGG